MSRRSVVVACVLALAVACSREAEAPPVAALARPIAARFDLDLQPIARDTLDALPGRPLTIPAQVAPWLIYGGTGRVIDGRLHVTVDPGMKSLKIWIPGPHDLRKFEGLALRVEAHRERKFELQVSANKGDLGWRDVAAPAREFDNATWTVMRSAFVAQALQAETVDAFELEFSGDLGAELVLDSFVLEFSPGASWVPLLEHAGPLPFPQQIATECRPSVGLLPSRTLRAVAHTPANGSRLAFGYAALDPFRGKPTKVALLAHIHGERGFQRDAELDIASTAKWRDFACDLDVPAGELITLELEVVVHGTGSACVAISTPQIFAPEPTPPTVVLITSDTHRGDHLGLAHQGFEIATPALDALAKRGLFFSDCFSATNITIPSHVAIMTGTHPLDSGLIGNNMTLGTGPRTIAESFRAAGYTTLAVTSINLLSSKIAGVDRGFDRMSWPAASRGSDRAVELALEWLGETRDRPVFLWLHVFDAHAPYEPPGHEKSGQRDDKKNDGDAVAVDDDGKARIPPWAGPNCDVACIRELYSGEISFLDQQLARLFADARVANAVVAFTGDHGEVLGTHGVYWAHKLLYPDTLHVPLILAWPGAPAGERVEAPAMNIDVGRTLLDLAGLRDAQFPGRDLVAAERAGHLGDAPRFGLEGRAHSASVTWKGWHLLLQLEELPEHERHENKALHQVELYHLADDPECEHDLIEKDFSRAKELRRELVRWLAGWRGERWVGAVRQDAETLRELAKLGYASESGAALGNKPLLDEHCACPWCARFR